MMPRSANPFPVSYRHSPSRQRGVATLLVTMVLLLALALIVLHTNRGAIMEQRLSANEIRTKQAFAAANAGVAHALAYMRKGGIDQDKDGVVDVVTSNTLTRSGGQSSFYKALYCDPLQIPHTFCPSTHTTAFSCTLPPSGSPQPVVPMKLTKVAMIGCGWSDDDSSVQRMVQLGGMTPSLGGTVVAPITSRGTANLLTGGASIQNYFSDLTVWSGGGLLGQSNTGKTFIRNTATNPIAGPADPYRAVGNSPACNNPPAGYQCSTQGSTLGHDTVLGDTSLSSMSTDGFFQYLFGQTPSAYREGTASWVVDPAGALATRDATILDSIVDMRDNSIWVEGNASLPGNVGTPDHPVILIVNGNLDLGGSAVINGMVYVTGTITGSGSPTIFGGIASGGDANVTGNLKVVFDPIVLDKVTNLGKAAQLPGSWRDW